MRVSSDGAFWVVSLPFVTPAAEVRLQFPSGTVIELGDTGGADNEVWFSRNPDGTSGRIGPEAGVHRVFFRTAPAVWQRLDAEFDESGTLIAVNGDAYERP